MSGSRYTVYIGNDAAGGDANLAAVNFYNTDPAVPVESSGELSRLVAFAQYLLPAANTYISGIAVGDAAGGGQFFQEFPAGAYAALAADDTALEDMDAWGVRYGFNALSPLGTGAVITRRTDSPGRTGRGRLTTPWLPVSWVDSNGSLATGGPAIIVEGWERYMLDVTDFDEHLNSSAGLRKITSITVADRLGRVKTRTR